MLSRLPEPAQNCREGAVLSDSEAWIASVSTRRLAEPVQAMGITGISKSSMSKLCTDIDGRVPALRKRRLVGG
jgi:transposase-like protein